jgi:hypothetical protein
MIPFRVIRSGMLLAGLLAALGGPLRAGEGGFTATLAHEEREAAGLAALTVPELAALDQLVAEDFARARQLQTSALHGTLESRHSAHKFREAGLDRLTPEQLARLDALVDEVIYARPQPRERPRLTDNDVVSVPGRLQVHGGLSFTIGSAGSGRSFRETAGWVSYYDPITGLGLGFAYSTGSGDGYYNYSERGYYPAASSYYSANPRPILLPAERTGSSGLIREESKHDGTSLRALPGDRQMPRRTVRR